MRIDFGDTAQTPFTDLLEYALQFFATELNIPRDYRLRFTLLDDMFLDETTGLPAMEGEPICGAVFSGKEHYDTDVDNVSLGIWYNLDPGSLFLVLAHEMVHVSQYASRTMRTIQDEQGIQNYWNGVLFDSEECDYYDLPWEIEAYERQDRLLEKLIESESFIPLIDQLTKNFSVENGEKLF